MTGFIVKTARMKLKCRECGTTIPKGDKYVVEWEDAFHKYTLCTNCARKHVIGEIMWRAGRAADIAFYDYMAEKLGSVTKYTLWSISTTIARNEYDEREYENFIKTSSFIVRLPKSLHDAAKELGIDVEEEVRKVYPKAMIC